jgi:hypothetical protein
MQNRSAIEALTRLPTRSDCRVTGSATLTTLTTTATASLPGTSAFTVSCVAAKTRFPHSILFESTLRATTARDVGFVRDGSQSGKAWPTYGSVWLKTAEYAGTITSALEADTTGGERYASSVLTNINGDWKQYRFKLVPGKSDPLAKIAILFNGHGRLWLDQVSLLPGDAERGDSTLEGKAVPTIDAVVSLSIGGREIFIKAVNTDPANAVTTKVSLAGAQVSPQARIETLNSDGLMTSNDFGHPDSVHVSTSQISSGRVFMVTLPEHSVSVITLEVER